MQRVAPGTLYSRLLRIDLADSTFVRVFLPDRVIILVAQKADDSLLDDQTYTERVKRFETKSNLKFSLWGDKSTIRRGNTPSESEII